ncbi:MAG TPA: hypothetical protein VM779_10310 [Thermoanaerobaculia bacterium]|nr:hypothetical protein [Thermoanaerobaculia bacterium]
MSYLRKKIGVAVAALAVAAVPAMAQQTIQKETFGITLPAGFAEFKAQVQKAESPEGTVETTNWVSRAAESGQAVVVTMSTMPGRILDPEKMMDSTRDSLLKSLKATLESENDIEGEMPATMIQFRSEAAVLQSKLLVDDDRLFQVLYVGRSAEQRAEPAIGQLFSSFRVVPKPEPATATTTSAAQPTEVAGKKP